MTDQDFDIIDRLCNKKEVCSFCNNILEVVKDCIVMNECGHVMHESCFRKLSDIQQYSCYSCQTKINMTLVVNQIQVVQLVRDGENVEMRRKEEYESKITFFFLKQLNNMCKQNGLIAQKDNEIIQLKNQIVTLQRNVQDLLLRKENQYMQQNKSSLYNQVDLQTIKNSNIFINNNDQQILNKFEENSYHISTLADINKDSQQKQLFQGINDQLFDSNRQFKVICNWQENTQNWENINCEQMSELNQQKSENLLKQQQYLYNSNPFFINTDLQNADSPEKIKQIELNSYNMNIQFKSQNNVQQEKKNSIEKQEIKRKGLEDNLTHEQQVFTNNIDKIQNKKQKLIDSFKFSFGSKKTTNSNQNTQNDSVSKQECNEQNVENKNDNKTIIFTQQQINDITHLNDYVSSNSFDKNTIASNNSKKKSNDSELIFNDSQTTKDNESVSNENSDSQITNKDSQININDSLINSENSNIVLTNSNIDIQKQQDSALSSLQNIQIDQKQLDSNQPNTKQQCDNDSKQISIQPQDIHMEQDIKPKQEQNIQSKQFQFESPLKQQQTDKKDDKIQKSSSNKVRQNSQQRIKSPQSIRYNNSKRKELNRSASKEKSYNIDSYSKRKDKSPKETKIRFIVENCIQSFSKIKQKLNFSNFLSSRNNQLTDENINTINLPHLNVQNQTDNNQNTSQQQLSCQESMSGQKITFNKLARRSNTTLNINDNSNILTKTPKYI